MPATPPVVRYSALAAPFFLLLYGVLRLIDGLDGSHGPGPLWTVGHSMFLVAIVLLGVVIAALPGLFAGAAPWRRVLARVAMVVGLVGTACFVWVITGDLSPAFHDAAPLPDALELVGPIMFELGILIPLVLLVATRPRRLPVWSPILVLVGFLLFSADLDLLPIGALVILAGLAPLARRRRPVQH